MRIAALIFVACICVAGCVGCGPRPPQSGGETGRGTTSTAAPAATTTSTVIAPAVSSAPLIAYAATSVSSPSGPAIPARLSGSPTGRQFLAQTASLPLHSSTTLSREDSIVHEFLAGNVPDYDRTFVDVTMNTGTHTATIHVLPDYLAIGSNTDNVRMPMGAPSAQRLADAFGCVLPTSKMVDAIWKQAVVKLAPHPLPPTAQMITNAWFLKHADAVDAQLVGKPRGVLTAGHKKDVITSNLIALHPGHVVIYGWHQLNGVPIQQRQWIHEATYADYSHGIRLVDRYMEVDGKTMLVDDVLKSATLSSILSNEGPIVHPRY